MHEGYGRGDWPGSGVLAAKPTNEPTTAHQDDDDRDNVGRGVPTRLQGVLQQATCSSSSFM